MDIGKSESTRVECEKGIYLFMLTERPINESDMLSIVTKCLLGLHSIFIEGFNKFL